LADDEASRDPVNEAAVIEVRKRWARIQKRASPCLPEA
jgi:hypothetical protein